MSFKTVVPVIKILLQSFSLDVSNVTNQFFAFCINTSFFSIMISLDPIFLINLTKGGKKPTMPMISDLLIFNRPRESDVKSKEKFALLKIN